MSQINAISENLCYVSVFSQNERNFHNLSIFPHGVSQSEHFFHWSILACGRFAGKPFVGTHGTILPALAICSLHQFHLLFLSDLGRTSLILYGGNWSERITVRN